MTNKATAFFKKFPAATTAAVVCIFTIIEALFSFCTTITCPPFADVYFDRWFPYKPNQSVYFLSSQGRTDTLQIERVNKSLAYTSSGSRGDCGSGAEIASTSSHNIFKLLVTYQKSSATTYLTLDFYTLKLTASKVTNEGLLLKQPQPYTTASLLYATIGNKRFTKVFSVARDTITNKLPGVYKMWLGQQEGIVAFQNYPSMELWVKK